MGDRTLTELSRLQAEMVSLHFVANAEGFATVLGVARSTWYAILSGRRKLTNRVVARAARMWPHLGPLWVSDLMEAQGPGGDSGPVPTMKTARDVRHRGPEQGERDA